MKLRYFLLTVFIFLVLTYSLCIRLGLKPINSDGLGYYSYLPSVMIYHDIDKPNLALYDPARHYLEFPSFSFWQVTGKYIDKYPPGTAILQLPMFLLAVLVSYIYGLPIDGFNPIFQFLVGLAGPIYLVISFYLLFQVLKLWFKPRLIYLALIMLLLGTSLLNYTINSPTFSHIYAFFGISLFLYINQLWHKRPRSYKLSILMGLTLGLNFMVRNTNILIILFCLFYSVNDWQSLKSKLKLLLKSNKQIILILTAGLLAILPQVIYQYHLTGYLWVNAYGSEGFHWLDPAWYGVLFSPRRGVFFWAPVLLVGLLSVFWRLRVNKEHVKSGRDPIVAMSTLQLQDDDNMPWFGAGMIYLLAQTYLIACWYQWWFGDAFGHRAFIDSYPIMAFYLTAGLSWVYQKGWTGFRPYLVSLLIILCLIINLKLQLKYLWGELPGDNVTLAKYWQVLSK